MPLRPCHLTRLALLAAASACASPGGAAHPGDFPRVVASAPGVRLSSVVREYTVTSPSRRALSAEMQRVGPRVDGRPFAGATRWSVRWSFRYATNGAFCELRDVRAVVESTIQLPKWVPASPPDSATRAWWSDFRVRLAEHEAGHARHGVEAAAEVVRQLQALRGGSCEALGMRASAIGRDIVERARARDAAYDRETAHGALQPGFPAPRVAGLALGVLPPMGVAVRDSAGSWCAAFPARRQVPTGAILTIVFVRPADTVAVRALAIQARESACPTAFAQPRWDGYAAFDLRLLDSARFDLPTATLVFAGRAPWTRGADGVPRALLDRDEIPEEARRCLGGEGEHFTIWSADSTGARRLRAHEYFDLGAFVDATCTTAEMEEVP